LGFLVWKYTIWQPCFSFQLPKWQDSISWPLSFVLRRHRRYHNVGHAARVLFKESVMPRKLSTASFCNLSLETVQWRSRFQVPALLIFFVSVLTTSTWPWNRNKNWLCNLCTRGLRCNCQGPVSQNYCKLKRQPFSKHKPLSFTLYEILCLGGKVIRGCSLHPSLK
jgi:hypothetical protein